MQRSALLLAALALLAPPVRAATVSEAVFDKSAIRCGYVAYEPALVKDLKTGAFTGGFDYDVTMAVANRLLLRASYDTATSWATVVPDLNTNKFDMLCNTYWVNPKSAKFMLFSCPVYYQPVYIVARADDTRFDADYRATLNDEKISIAAVDGDNPVFIAKADFPKAKLVELSNMTDFSQVLATVASGKADATIVDANTFGLYNAGNPGKLKVVNPGRPVRIFPASFGFKVGEEPLREAVDAALNELILDGTLDRIFDRYEKYPNAIYRATVTYRNPYKN